jgi:GTP-binding protein EngB required for normal cell division
LKRENNIPPVLIKYLEEFKNCKYEMIMLGNTKAGKSTLLNEIMENKLQLNTGPGVETAFMWRLMFSETFENYDMQNVY